MNSIDPLTLEMVAEAVELVEMGDFVGLVIGNDGEHFSAGANIGLALFVANVGAWEESDKMIRGGQLAFMTLKHSSFPVVGASSGLAIGGGCEVLLACDAIQAHAETYTGLVEVGVGLVPAWGGCKEMLRRWAEVGPHGPMAPVTRIFENVGTAKVATSAFEARDKQILRDGDGITMNRERVLADAKARCLEMVASYEPPEIATHRLAGPSGQPQTPARWCAAPPASGWCPSPHRDHPAPGPRQRPRRRAGSVPSGLPIRPTCYHHLYH